MGRRSVVTGLVRSLASLVPLVTLVLGPMLWLALVWLVVALGLSAAAALGVLPEEASRGWLALVTDAQCRGALLDAVLAMLVVVSLALGTSRGGRALLADLGETAEPGWQASTGAPEGQAGPDEPLGRW